MKKTHTWFKAGCYAVISISMLSAFLENPIPWNTIFWMIACGVWMTVAFTAGDNFVRLYNAIYERAHSDDPT